MRISSRRRCWTEDFLEEVEVILVREEGVDKCDGVKVGGGNLCFVKE